MLGNLVESALSVVGITQDRVEKWVGGPCGCEERKRKLNSLHHWALRIVSGKVDKASEYLEQIIDD